MSYEFRIHPVILTLLIELISSFNAALVDKYVGCYVEKTGEEREMSQYIGWSTSMTADYCIERCAAANMTFAALQRGDECWCGNTFGGHGRVHEGECRHTCYGNDQQFCGGETGISSIYSVCPRGLWFPPRCYYECKCDGWYCQAHSGECTSICSGNNCTIDNGNTTEVVKIPDFCSDNNGGCSHNCRNTLEGPQCFCNSGYQISDGNTCIDTNECRLANGGCSHTCNDLVGSYSCSCLPGYRLEGKYACTDVDECATRESGCPHYCTNTEGNFTCHCRAGFEKVSEKNCSDACTSTFELMYPQDRKVSSGCSTIKEIRANLTVCKQKSCEERGNTFNFKENECHIKHCLDAYLITDANGGWAVYAKRNSVNLRPAVPRSTVRPLTGNPSTMESITVDPADQNLPELKPGGFQNWMIAVIIVPILAAIAIVVTLWWRKKKQTDQLDESSTNGKTNKAYDDLAAYDNFKGRAGKKKGDARITITDGMDIDVVNKQSYPNLGKVGTIRNKTLHKGDTHYDDMIVAS